MKHFISIIVPIYHDCATIGNTIDTLISFFKIENLNAEIIIVNDGGKDNGVKIVQEKIKKYPLIKLINRKENKGKGYSVREGLKAAEGYFIFYTDADLPYLTEPIRKMLDLLKNKEADLILANREFYKNDYHEKTNLPRHITHKIYSLFVRTLLPIEFHDTLAGLKGMRKETAAAIIPKLSIDRFSFDVELLLAAKKMSFKIMEIPVSLKNTGKSNLSITKDAPQMAKDIIKIFVQNKKGMYD